jgi:hypothetical protein
MSFYQSQDFSPRLLHEVVEARFKVVVLKRRDGGVSSSIHDGFDAEFLHGVPDVPRFDCESESCDFHIQFVATPPNHALQRMAASRRGFIRAVSWPPSLSLIR